MTGEPEKGLRKKRSLLTGAALFLALVIYFNIRSPDPTQAVDWLVIGFGVLFFAFALVRRFLYRN